EAVSRGAEHATLVERNAKVAKGLKSMTAALMQGEDTDRIDVQCVDAVEWVEQIDARWDIVFLDPPFDDPVSYRLINALDARLGGGAWVYHEHRTGDAQSALPEHWRLHRSGRAGEASYALYQIRSKSHE
ncbi:MAG: RsmD family RNA methyltransferase, partial [Pseudomonadota bacterium]